MRSGRKECAAVVTAKEETRQINVPVPAPVYEAAKAASARAGMLFRKWVERAVADACDFSPVANPPDREKLREAMNIFSEQTRGTRYEPVDE